MRKLKLVLSISIVSILLFSSAKKDEEPAWEELASSYTYPEWFRDAKFGIWCHWGPQAVPDTGGGWYARHMYMPDISREGEKFGQNAYPYHVKTYGHPSEFGFKDVINLWKAEKFDPESLLSLFKECGARYFVCMGNHHDHFDNFASSHHPWNSVNMGPKRDIVGEFEKAARSRDLPFGITCHDNRHWRWFLPAFGFDLYGPKTGIPYDGRQTKADGKGKWWEGYDPADLYGPPPEERTPEWDREMKENWLARHLELVNKYKPDLLYYDGSFASTYGDYGKEVARTLHANSLKENGEIQTVMNLKGRGSKDMPGIVWQVERGVSRHLEERPWQSGITFSSYFYKTDRPLKHDAHTILRMLAETVSRNGNLLLNVELKPDGTIPEGQQETLIIVGDWLKENGEAIYGTRPWKMYGDGSSVKENRDSGAEKEEERNLENPKPYAYDEVRFTTGGGSLYVIVMDPRAGKLDIPVLGIQTGTRGIKAVTFLASGENAPYEQDEQKLTITIPGPYVSDPYPLVLEVTGALND